MVEELEERERAFKKARVDKQKEEVKVYHETEKIKEEGRKLREQKERELRMREKEREIEEEEDMEAPELNPLDTTVRLKYTLKAHPELTTPEAIAKLLAPFGAIDTESIVLSLRAPKKSAGKPPKTGTALVPFKQIGDAFAAVCGSGQADHGLDGVEVGWVNGKEPQILGWLKKMGKLGEPKPAPPVTTEKAELPQHQTAGSGGFSTFPSTFPDLSTMTPTAPTVDYESLTLLRLRQAERERLEREIVEQEGLE
ncbi:hypothetical protein P691DRAFT_809431 [Macrolepiota fuliginosa MF-IS2]|uniref:Uncharacterized protein n=1 Tax=Macrolepiota fuliginosa MF-IS2 TaxID=1400762 RepID=A0A9P5X2H6_9AGAR|nr:hypothetical protein P691DRAFT_809431 [Macrolepiota fuliginosa MF-IS2]